MSSLAQSHCLNHPVREAVARCPECRHFFCRECITDHDDRLVCASCLKKLSRSENAGRLRWQPLAHFSLSGAGLVIAVAFFYWVGKILLIIPPAFHNGTLWKASPWGGE